MEREPFEEPALRAAVEGAAGTRPRPSRAMRRLALLSALAEQRRNQLHFVLNLLTLWDLHVFFVLDDWRRIHGRKVRGWFDVLADLEALASLGGYFHDRPQLSFPVLSEDGPRFEATALAHPLLDAAVPNEVRLVGRGQLLLVTGSNMSGKSTLLRAMGLNAVLGLAGGPVSARSLALSALHTWTSMRVQDSLEAGVSFFYAEVQRLKRVLDGAAATPGAALVLVDEMLLGTNTRERRLASGEVVHLLLASGCIGAVTTHDLSLAELAATDGSRLHAVHFQDVLEDGQMRFDYKLRDGVVKSTNALRSWPWPASRCARSPEAMSRVDPHSHADDSQPRQRHLSWNAEVDFAARQLRATARLQLDSARGGPLDLDARDLTIEQVTAPSGAPVPWSVAPAEPILGSRLRIELPPGSDGCVVRYRTSPDASALQWLEPAQTAGGSSPFLFTQCQAIHARSVVPLQDTPRVRVTYDAALDVPCAAARRDGRGAVGAGGDRRRCAASASGCRSHPALPVRARGGRPGLAELGPRSGVGRAGAAWSARRGSSQAVDGCSTLGRGAVRPVRLGAVRSPVHAALVPVRRDGESAAHLPHPDADRRRPVAGERVAHELAHSWTGNLVSNAIGRALLAQRGLHRLRRAAHPRGARGAGVAGASRRGGPPALDEAVGNFARPARAHPAAHPARRRRPRRCVQPGAVREGLPLPACGGGRGGAGGVRWLPPAIHGPLPLPVPHHRGAAGLHPEGATRCAGGGRRAPVDRRRGRPGIGTGRPERAAGAGAGAGDGVA